MISGCCFGARRGINRFLHGRRRRLDALLLRTGGGNRSNRRFDRWFGRLSRDGRQRRGCARCRRFIPLCPGNGRSRYRERCCTARWFRDSFRLRRRAGRSSDTVVFGYPLKINHPRPAPITTSTASARCILGNQRRSSLIVSSPSRIAAANSSIRPGMPLDPPTITDISFCVNAERSTSPACSSRSAT